MESKNVIYTKTAAFTTIFSQKSRGIRRENPNSSDPLLQATPQYVIPAKAGIHKRQGNWIPAFAGMTDSSVLTPGGSLIPTAVYRHAAACSQDLTL
ncbi:MAG TPA: hypothetical protein ENI81_06690 [Phycisphaerales bacterium]|nr:hypothetical protein [Phycisphaerales bacterium]